jgi:hypothetical protein
MATNPRALSIDNPQPPRLPDAPGDYNRSFVDNLTNILRLYFNRLSNLLNVLTGENGAIELQTPHAMLMSDQDQTNPSITGANIVSYNQPVITQGIEVRGDNNDQIWFEKTGQYLVTFSLQVTNRSNAAQEFEVWAGYNGSNYPLSNTRFDIPARKSTEVWSHIVPAVSGIFTVQNPDTEYLTIKWWASSTDVFLEHYPVNTSPTRPAIPSVILTVNGVSRLPQQSITP